ncbi:MAG TPA: thioredoxin family protein [Thermohalobaculum sp.]|nr:thioredoxin family protein [Thermohalobaculum sp.]
MQSPAQPIVSREEWLAARTRLLEDEKAFTRARDALSARRRALPWVRVEKDYRFRTPDGEKTLGDLFGPHSQLIVSHFMFGPDWEQGCPSCSFWADGYNGLEVHMAHRDAGFVAVSNTAPEKIGAYRQRMGWSFPWVSSLGSEFNRDFQVSFTEADKVDGEVYYNYARRRFPASEAPGISVFYKPEPGTVVHTYSTYARGLDMLNAAYHLMDLLPKGRDEDGLDFTMAWLRRRDEYAD